MKDKISFSVYQERESLKSFLIEALNLSSSKLKKLTQEYDISKKLLVGPASLKREFELAIGLMNEGMINPLYCGDEIRVIEDHDGWMAVEKPSGCHCHPLSYDDQNNVLSFLRMNNYLNPLSVNTNHYDRGILYRLDFETSGILLIAKKNHLYRTIRENFHDLAKRKIYLARVKGDSPEQGILENTLTQTGKTIKEKDDGKLANLEFQKLSYNEKDNTSLLGIKLISGLRHQIRVQLSLAGYPIIGDTLYGGPKADRLYLHAYHYHMRYNDIEFSSCSKKDDLIKVFPDLDSRLDMLRDKFKIG